MKRSHNLATSTDTDVKLKKLKSSNYSEAEKDRLKEAQDEKKTWKKWGPYLSERQWGTVREDYSPDGKCWEYFPHEHSRSRAYRWGEDGLMGICDDKGYLCLGLSLWNGEDPFLKERLFGLTGPQGNHGEDVKECYFYLDSTPTHSYLKALYKYSQTEFPYEDLVKENKIRTNEEPEYELENTGAFDCGYWDVLVEYAKNTPQDILNRFTFYNRGPKVSSLHVLPTLWFRNTWSWDNKSYKPQLFADGQQKVFCSHERLGKFIWLVSKNPDNNEIPSLIFTENETNRQVVWSETNITHYTKDAFHRYIVNKDAASVNPKQKGTKCAAVYMLTVPPGQSAQIRCRLIHKTDYFATKEMLNDNEFKNIFDLRINEANEFYKQLIPMSLDKEKRNVMRKAYAGLLWTKQLFIYNIKAWLAGDAVIPNPPEERQTGRNYKWKNLRNSDIISMPDKWEFPWYASWDLAFHMIPFVDLDPDFVKEQLVLFLSERYMHPNGQIPAYEFDLSDVNPPVHAWACLKVFKATASSGSKDYYFLGRCFQKLLLNFTWWISSKDPESKNLFSGGFLGMDNISVFDRSQPLPNGGELEQADGTAWVAFFAVTMMKIALELAHNDKVYVDMAIKFLVHFMSIVDALNQSDQNQGLWDNKDGFYYDHMRVEGVSEPLRIRSLVGLVPLFSCIVLEREEIEAFPEFQKQLNWFSQHQKLVDCKMMKESGDHFQYLLSIPTKHQLVQILNYLLNEEEFLSPYGIRSLSKFHKLHPFICNIEKETYQVDYAPGESNVDLFGGNSNWRGPIWLCMNYLIIQSLKHYDNYYKDSLMVECPKGSKNLMRLREVAEELSRRITLLFLPDKNGHRPCNGGIIRYAKDPYWKNLVLFYEYFHGDNGRGCGASHQTGWTALIVKIFQEIN